MPCVLAQHCGEVVWSGDQEVVEAFPAERADEAFRDRVARGARIGVRMIRMSVPVKTASKAAVNLLSRSRIRNWSRSACGVPELGPGALTSGDCWLSMIPACRCGYCI